jgi:hypothetical protein
MKNIFIILLLLLAGCTNKEKRIVPVEDLFHKSITNRNYFIGSVGPIILVDSYIIGLEYSLDTCFYYLGLENDVFKRFGNRGQGPDEYVYPDLIEYVNDTVLGVYDMMKREYIELSIPFPSVNHSGKIKTISFEEPSFSMQSVCFNRYIGTGPYENGMFKLYDSTGKMTNHFYEFPYRDNDERNLSNRFRSMAYQGHITLNPQKNKMAYACTDGEIIHFYELTKDSIEIIKKTENIYPEYVPQTIGDGISAAMKKENKVGYLSLYSTDTFVYALYSGVSANDFFKTNTFFSGNILYIYDWKGNIKRKIKLDIACVHICISNDDKKMYAIAEYPEPTIVYHYCPTKI